MTSFERQRELVIAGINLLMNQDKCIIHYKNGEFGETSNDEVAKILANVMINENYTADTVDIQYHIIHRIVTYTLTLRKPSNRNSIVITSSRVNLAPSLVADLATLAHTLKQAQYVK